MNPAGISGASNPIANFGLHATTLTSPGAAWSLGGPCSSLLNAVWPYGPLPNAFPSPSFPLSSLTSPSFWQVPPGGFAASTSFLLNGPSFLPVFPADSRLPMMKSSVVVQANDPHQNRVRLHAGPVPASTPTKVYRCHKCEFTTKSVEDLGEHWDTAHKFRHTWLTCPKCDYRSRSMTSMIDHGKTAHNEVALKVIVRRMYPRKQADCSIVNGAVNFLKRRGPNILRADSKRIKVVSNHFRNAWDESDQQETDELQRAPTAPAVSSGCETPDVPSALVIDERDDEWSALEQQLQQSNKRNDELEKKSRELAELIKQLEKQLADKEHDAKEKDALLENLSEENALLNSDALRRKEAQQQLFAQQKQLCSQITQQLQAVMQCATLTPQYPLIHPLQTAMYYVDLLQQSPTQLEYILQKHAPNPGHSL